MEPEQGKEYILKKDLSTKGLLEYPDVFADIGNVCLFGGKKYIRPENLELCPQQTVYKEADGALHEHRGDIRMRLKENGLELAILHVENQSELSNIMPLRDMGYVYSGYQEQIRRLKDINRKTGLFYGMKEIGEDQKLHPVVSLILYYGTDEWMGPSCLMDMLDLPSEERDHWLSIVQDYKIHLIDLGRQSDELVSQYESDLWYIIKCLKCGKDKEKYKSFLTEGIGRRMDHPEAVIDMITAFAGKTKAKLLAEQIINQQRDKGGDCTMYSFLDYFEEVGLEKGIERGIEQGIQQGIERGIEQGIERGMKEGMEKGQEKIYYRMFSNNRTPEDISEFTGDPVDYLNELHEKYLAAVREENKYET